MDRPELSTVGAALNALQDAARPYSETPLQDAQVLLARLLGVNRAWVAVHSEAVLDAAQAATLSAQWAAIAAGQPLPYVLGEWAFYGRDFRVTPDVLIPRPETELLIETALAWLDARPERQAVADIGTGSGIIAVTLAAERPGLAVTAGDISPAALAVARENTARHTAAVTFMESDLLAGMNGPFDLIAANLPYIPSEPLKALPIYGREPLLALDGGVDGLALIRRLLADAPRVLAPGGLVLLEIDAASGAQSLAAARAVFSDATMDVLRDLAGHERLVRIQS